MKNINSAFHQVSWPVLNALAFTTTRAHPYRKHNHCNGFQYFNLGTHVGDDLDVVNEHRAILNDFLPLETKIQWLEQVHGNQVASVQKHHQVPLVADAAVTTNKNIALAIMTADCLPILLASINGDEIAAIHGGWRPLASNIIARTLAKIQTKNQQIYAWLGPCIGKNAFEVGEEVRQAFLRQSSSFKLAFKKVASDKYLADLHQIAILQLNALGVDNISVLPHCTFSMPDQYYSYRRDNKTGRMATVICRI